MTKIGLLGLYLELYDECSPDMRSKVDGFYEKIAVEFESRGFMVLRKPLCRIAMEFNEAITEFENKDADVLVTLHLAYSPSLESAKALKKTRLPVFILNTTPDFFFEVTGGYNAISYNHGIHGVQDMCNLLLRNEKSFEIETGHWEKSNVIDRLAEKIKAFCNAKTQKKIRVGIIGSPFKGMGDFAVDFNTLKETLGIETVICDYDELKNNIKNIKEEEINTEIAANEAAFEISINNMELYKTNIKNCLGVRKWIEGNNLDAFTVNFLDVDSKNGLSSVPFYEASKQMAAGKGYAGEGDVMTAGLVSALSGLGCETSFTEIFCPDWSQNALFLSHMGEMNINLCREKPILHEKDYIFSDVEVNPIVFSGEFKPGKALLVNLSPSISGYTLIIAQVEMFSCDKVKDGVRGWLRPEMSISKFLSEYSRYGGTHHSALVYGDHLDKIKSFALENNIRTLILE